MFVGSSDTISSKTDALICAPLVMFFITDSNTTPFFMSISFWRYLDGLRVYSFFATSSPKTSFELSSSVFNSSRILEIFSSLRTFCLRPTETISVASIILIFLLFLLNTSNEQAIPVFEYKLDGSAITASTNPFFTNFSRITVLIPPFQVTPLLTETTAFPCLLRWFMTFIINTQSPAAAFCTSGIILYIASNSSLFPMLSFTLIPQG